MTILTIDEAARFLRLTKRTLYQRLDIPRVRYGHRVMFIEEDLERWVRAQQEVPVETVETIDESKPNSYHRNRLFF
jgi:excisionase family DNA binding protein